MADDEDIHLIFMDAEERMDKSVSVFRITSRYLRGIGGSFCEGSNKSVLD